MNISEAGQSMIEGFEGLRTKAYQDIAGIWTIGYGHTGSDVHEGLEWPPEHCAGVLLSDLTIAENGVDAAITKPMTQGQFDAFVSLAFNIGIANFRHSSAANLFNQGDVDGAGNAMLLWNRAGGKFSAGLAERRTKELQMFKGQLNG